MATSTSLTCDSTTSDCNQNVVLICSVSNHQGFLDHCYLLLNGKKLRNGFSIDNDFAFTLSKINAGSSCFSSSGTVCKILNHCSSPLHLDLYRLLCRMGVIRTGIHFDVCKKLVSECSFGEHTLNSFFHGSGGLSGNQFVVVFRLQSTKVT